MSGELPASLTILLEVIDILEKLQVHYHLGGSFASAIHGVPRQTLDADLVVDLEVDQVAPLVADLERSFYVDSLAANEAVSRRGSFNAIHLESGFKVDFFVKGAGEFDDVELDRSERIEIVPEPSRSVLVKTADGRARKAIFEIMRQTISTATTCCRGPRVSVSRSCSPGP